MLKSLTLSLQFGRLTALAQHRSALPRHQVTRWLRHAARLFLKKKRLHILHLHTLLMFFSIM
jgi:hypothetical protein